MPASDVVRRTILTAAVLCLCAAPLAADAGHTRTVEVLRFSPDGSLLASGSHDATLRVWDAATGRPVRVLTDHRLPVSDVAFAADGKRMLSAGWDGTAILWDVNKGEAIRRLTGHTDLIEAVALSPDARRAATCGNDKTVRLWDVETGRQVQITRLGDPVPVALALSPDGKTLAAGTKLGTVLLWNVPEWKQTAALDVGGNVAGLAFADDGQLLIGRRGGVQRWDVAAGKKLDEYADDEDRPTGAFGVARNAKTLAAAGRRGVTLWSGDETSRLGGKADWSAVAVSADGKRVAAGQRSGRIVTWNVDQPDEPLWSAAPGPRAPEPSDGPDDPVGSMLDANLLAGEQRDRWRVVSQTEALRWADDGGLWFKAASTPTHMVGRDHMTAGTGLGNRPFELTFDVQIDHVAGPQVFYPGLAVGLSSAPLKGMTEDDVAAVIAVHFDGIWAGATRGEPYRITPSYHQVRQNAVTRLASSGRKNVVGWSPDARATFQTGRPIRLRIRRDALNVLTFTIWCPAAGQTPADPWWERQWTMPDDLADKPLEHLFVKRVPVAGDHLGAQGVGYGEILKLEGRLESLTLRPSPPAVTEVSWNDAVLQPGSTMTIRGAGFQGGATVSVGGKPAPDCRRISQTELRCALPELAPGRRYHVGVANPDGPSAWLRDSAAVGRLIENVSLVESAPAGGEEITLSGAGFEPGTKVHFGDRAAGDVERVDAFTMKVRVPEGQPGPAPITARTGEHQFAGRIGFGYVRRPSLWFDDAGLRAWRDKLNRPALTPYRDAILAAGERFVEARPGRGHGAETRARAVIWAHALTDEDRYHNRVIGWIDHFSEEPEFGGWSYRTAGLTAVGYDLVADELDPQLRRRVQRYLLDTLDRYVAEEAAGDWFITNDTSTNPTANSAAVAIALTFAHVRNDSDRIIDAARGHATNYLANVVTPHGGWIEGMSWAVDGLTDYLEIAHLIERHRGDRAMLEHPRLDNIAREYETMLATPDELLTYGNMHGGLKGVAVCAEIGGRDDDLLLTWIADRVAEKGDAADAGKIALASMWRSTKPGPDKAPPLPIVSVLPDVSWATLRSAPRVDTPFLLGLKGLRGPTPYHQQQDTGSLVLFGHGDQLVIDPGWGQSAARQHTLPLIDGAGPDKTGGRITDTWSGGPWRAAVADVTDAYRWRTGARRVRRTAVLHTGGTVVVLDDIAPPDDAPGRVAWNLQTGAAEIDNDTATVTVPARSAAMTAKLFGPDAELSVERHKRRFSESHWHTVTAAYEADADRPLVAVFRVAAGEKAPPVDAKATCGDDAVRVNLGGRGTLRFRRTEHGWGLVLPTDEKRVLLTPLPPRGRPVARAARAETPPMIDGKLDDTVWQAAEPLAPFGVAAGWADAPPAARFATQVKFAWDAENLYVAVRAHEPKLESMVSRIEGPAQSVYNEDRFELLIDPGREHATNRYYGMTILASGMPLGGFGKAGDVGTPKMKLATGRDADAPKAWTLELAVAWDDLLTDPWSKLHVHAPAQGMNMGLNLLRHRTRRPRETSAWVPVHGSPHAVPWRWGLLVLE